MTKLRIRASGLLVAIVLAAPAAAADPSSSPPRATEPADAVRARARERLAALEQAQTRIAEASRALELALEHFERIRESA